MSRNSRFVAIALVLLNVVQCAPSTTFAANPSPAATSANSESTVRSQAAPQGSALRIIGNSAPSAPIKPQAAQVNLPSLDERLLAAAIYANNVHASQSELAAALASEPKPAVQHTAAPDLAELLQSSQGAALAANPQATIPLKIKLSIGPAPTIAAEPTATSTPSDLPVADRSPFAVRSITKASVVPHAPNRFVEPESSTANDALFQTEAPSPTASAGVDWADALAGAVHQIPGRQINNRVATIPPTVPVSQSIGTERAPDSVPTQEMVATTEPAAANSDTIAVFPEAAKLEPQSLAVAAVPNILADQTAVVVDPPVIAAAEPVSRATHSGVATNDPATAQNEIKAAEDQPAVIDTAATLIGNSRAAAADHLFAVTVVSPASDAGPTVLPIESKVASTEPPATKLEAAAPVAAPAPAVSIPTVAVDGQPTVVQAPKLVENIPSADVAASKIQVSTPAKVVATPAIATSKPTIAISRFAATSRKIKEESDGSTLATTDLIETAAQPTVAAQHPTPDWKATDFIVAQPTATQVLSEVGIAQVGSPPLDMYAMAEQQSAGQQMPTSAETTILPPPTTTYSPTLEAMGIPPTPMPLTNSSYLPASPENYCYRCGVKCPDCGCNPGGPGWNASRPIPWEVFAQGEYIGPARLAHVPIYRLRVDDRLAFVYRLSGQVAGTPYRLNVRDRIQVQSLSAPEVINRELIVQPDGTITLPLIGQIRAAGATLDELSKHLDEELKSQIKDPRITVTPLVMNSNLEELRSSVDRRYGQGGQVSDARVSPDGTVQLPAIGLVPAQGMTLDELEREVKTRYARIVEGLEVTPILLERAPRYIFVVGEVKAPGRYAMEGPTTLMQSIAMAGSWNVGAQLNHVVVFRRDENWQLMATRLNIRTSLLFKKPCPEGEIWLRDSDVVLIPKSPILCTDDMIDLVFTRGIYGIFPMNATLNFAKLSTL